MRGFVLGVIATLVALVIIVIAVTHLGLYPIGADNAPSHLERTLAGRAMDVYADKHKPAGDNPIAPTAANLTQGALQYEQHCALCHGGAKAKVSTMQNQFSPPAPQLVNRIPHDPPSWMFWVTKHGVRMTGMPAWTGILSDEDIWKIVAFIKNSGKLPPETQAAWQASAANR
jgi:mono/diheme cytochrome c family protein